MRRFLSLASCAVAAAVAWLACGEALTDEPDPVAPPVRDSGADGSDSNVGGDGGVDPPDGRVPSCLGAPFTSIAHRPDLSSPGDEQSVTLSLDELEVYVGTTHAVGTGNYDIYTARRSTTGQAFPALIRADALSSPQEDYAVALTSDATGVVVASQRGGADGGGGQDLFFTFRTSANTTFVNPLVAIDTLNTTASEGAPFFAPSNVLYFSRGNAPNYLVMRANRVDASTFDSPIEVSEINDGGGETFSVAMSNDGTTIFFGTDARPGSQATDIYVATRAGASGAFGAPVRVTDPGVNTASDERPGFLSADGCRLYFVSNRAGGLGDKDVYLATRSPR